MKSHSVGRPKLAALPSWLLAVAVTAPTFGHDFWIEPADFRPEPPASVGLSLRVGEDFEGRAVMRRSRSIVRFVATGPGGTSQIGGLEGRDPAGFLGVAEAGDYFAGYESRGQKIELPAGRFERYLEHEGLERIIDLRRERGQSSAPGREAFVRCAKTHLRAGESGEALSDEPLGLTLELLLAPEPAALRPSATFRVQVLFQGEPAPDLLVVARHRDDPGNPHEMRTDSSGYVQVPVAPGEWLVKSVHMVEAEEGAGADWVSYWGSITFALDPLATPAAEPPS